MIVNIFTDPHVGGTFLSWSLHYLSGDIDTYHARTKTWRPLSDSPLTELSTAHNWAVNQCCEHDEIYDFLLRLTEETPKSFHSLYLHIMHHPRWTNWIQFEPALATAIDTLRSVPESKTIVLQLPSWQKLYKSKFEERTLHKKYTNPNVKNKTHIEQHEDYIDAFFSHDKPAWDFTLAWEHREFLALNLRPYNFLEISQLVSLSKEHYRLNGFELYNNFDNTVYNLFDFLELSIDNNRKQYWNEIYKEWQKFHSERIVFAEYFDQIILSIINNHYLDLRRFNLDIVRESIIQHVLIYKYGLTLKSWGLDKFPNNTQDLHVLLEPNIYHKVEDIYQVFKT